MIYTEPEARTQVTRPVACPLFVKTLRRLALSQSLDQRLAPSGYEAENGGVWKRVLFGTGRRPGEGLSAAWWAVTSVTCAVGALVLLLDHVWWAGLFVVPAVWSGVITYRRAREGNLL